MVLSLFEDSEGDIWIGTRVASTGCATATRFPVGAPQARPAIS